jgi:hypothetical protein
MEPPHASERRMRTRLAGDEDEGALERRMRWRAAGSSRGRGNHRARQGDEVERPLCKLVKRAHSDGRTARKRSPVTRACRGGEAIGGRGRHRTS